jgi:hypothetical protein
VRRRCGGSSSSISGEAPDRLEEAVVSVVVVHGADLADEHRLVEAVELVVEARGKGDALARREDDHAAALHRAGHPVEAHRDGVAREGPLGGRGVELHGQPAAPAVDDVLGLAPVEVPGRHLIHPDHEQLLGVELAPSAREVVRVAVAEGEQQQAAGRVVALSEVRHVPAEAVFGDLAGLRADRRPLLRRPRGEGRQEEAARLR